MVRCIFHFVSFSVSCIHRLYLPLLFLECCVRLAFYYMIYRQKTVLWFESYHTWAIVLLSVYTVDQITLMCWNSQWYSSVDSYCHDHLYPLLVKWLILPLGLHPTLVGIWDFHFISVIFFFFYSPTPSRHRCAIHNEWYVKSNGIAGSRK
jgi:hypothetical protein